MMKSHWLGLLGMLQSPFVDSMLLVPTPIGACLQQKAIDLIWLTELNMVRATMASPAPRM